jgi:hypothetical protein
MLEIKNAELLRFNLIKGGGGVGGSHAALIFCFIKIE